MRDMGADGPVSSPGPNSGLLSLASGTPDTIPANAERLGIQLCADPAGGASYVYGLCGSTTQRGVVSSTNWDFGFAAGGSWDGEVTQAVWSGPIQLVSTGTIKVGVIEV